jgi:hypothetical protein
MKSLSNCMYLAMAVEPFFGPWLPFRFLNLYTVGRTPWMGYQPISRLLAYTQNNTDTE